MNNYITIVLAVLLNIGCLSSHTNRAKVNENRKSGGKIIFDDKFINDLKTKLSISIVSSVDEQLAKLPRKSVLSKMLTPIKEDAISDSNNRNLFLEFLKGHLPNLELLTIDHLYIIEKKFSGEIETSEFILIISTANKYIYYKAHSEYGKWSMHKGLETKIDVYNYFRTLRYFKSCKKGEYANLEAYVATSISASSVKSKAYAIICKDSALVLE